MAEAGKLNGKGTKVVTPEQMDLSRLRAENVRLKREFSLAEMCTILDVSVSGYRSWKRGGKPDRKHLTDTQMLTLIQSIHAELKGIYGSPRMVRELRDRGFPASKKRGLNV